MKISNFRNNELETPKCVFNDSGYCKFGVKCRKIHFKIICLIEKCNKKCDKRHPRICKFGKECDFLRKKICAYKHVTLAAEDDEFQALKLKLKQVEQENESLQEQLKVVNDKANKELVKKKESADNFRQKLKEMEK